MKFVIFAIFCSTAALAFAQNTLNSGEEMYINKVKFSPDRRFRLNMQSDGLLAVYRNPGGMDVLEDGDLSLMGIPFEVWSSETKGSDAKKVVMQLDGQLCLYDFGRTLIWTTYTKDAGSVLRLQDDGNLVIYNLQGKPVWNALGFYKTTV
jgi:hypothetical protein